MAEPNPLAGLTAEEADAAIDRLAAKAEEAEAHAKAVRAHLKAMKAARRDLVEPVPLERRGASSTDAQAEPAQITTEASGG
jgi:hypothetical protein